MSDLDNPFQKGDNIQNRNSNFTIDSKDTDSIKKKTERTNPSDLKPIFLVPKTVPQIPEKKNNFQFCRCVVFILGTLVILLFIVVLVSKKVSKSAKKEDLMPNSEAAAPGDLDPGGLDIIDMFTFFKYKYKSNKNNSVIFSDKALKIMKNMSHDINILSYNSNLDCVLMYYGYSGSGENKTIYGCAYLEKINDFF